MEVHCHRCRAQNYEGTGKFNASRFGGHRRAELKCRDCGYLWSSGLPDALEAGEAAAANLPPPPRAGGLGGLLQLIPGLVDGLEGQAQPTITPAELEAHRKRQAAIAARTKS